MDKVNIEAEKFSFREKLSFITNSSEYGKWTYKLWAICKLVVSRGNCKLPITQSSCNDIINNKCTKQCIFSRKIQRLIKDVKTARIRNARLYIEKIFDLSGKDLAITQDTIATLDKKIMGAVKEVGGDVTIENTKYYVDKICKKLAEDCKEIPFSDTDMFEDYLLEGVSTIVEKLLESKEGLSKTSVNSAACSIK